MTRLFEPPPTFELPLSKGGDIYFGIVYKPLLVDENNDPILDVAGKKEYVVADYPVGATVRVIIETTPASAANVVIDATIDRSVATVWGQSEEADLVSSGKIWRAVITYADGLDKILCNGKTARYDG